MLESFKLLVIFIDIFKVTFLNRIGNRQSLDKTDLSTQSSVVR